MVTDSGPNSRWASKAFGWVNVKDYGALGNGVADDTFAIDAAQTDCNLSYGRTLYFPNGTYLYGGSGLNVKTIRGENRQKTWVKYTGTGSAVVPVAATINYHRTISSLTLSGVAAGSSAVGLDLDTTPSGHFDNLIVSGFTTGIKFSATMGLSSSLYNVFDDVTVQSCTTGVLLDGIANENRFDKFRINQCTTGFDMVVAGRNVISSSAIENCTTGILIRGDALNKANVVQATRFESCTTNYQINAGAQYNIFTANRLIAGTVTDNGTGTVQLGADTSGLQIDRVQVTQPLTTSVGDGVKIINAATNTYALKIDQTGDGHDAVNISALGTGGFTSLGIVSANTSLSTVKVTNSGTQTGGVVIAALGTSTSRTASIFGAENSGGGASYLSTIHAGTGVAFQAIYDTGTAYTSRIMWLQGQHTSGDLVYIENAGVQTAGTMVKVVQTDAGSTNSVLQIVNNGTGSSIIADLFKVAKTGNVSAAGLLNYTTYNNSRVQMSDTGTQIDRNVADAGAALRINQISATSTGDLIQLQAASVVKARVTKGGSFATRNTTVPADADITTGEAAWWFDSTTAAAKIMWKAKDAGGTVRTGSLALA